jgi:hypothetical protein
LCRDLTVLPSADEARCRDESHRTSAKLIAAATQDFSVVIQPIVPTAMDIPAATQGISATS